MARRSEAAEHAALAADCARIKERLGRRALHRLVQASAAADARATFAVFGRWARLRPAPAVKEEAVAPPTRGRKASPSVSSVDEATPASPARGRKASVSSVESDESPAPPARRAAPAAVEAAPAPKLGLGAAARYTTLGEGSVDRRD